MAEKTAMEQKLDDLKEIVVDGFNKNSAQHSSLYAEQKKTNGNVINHEARIKQLECNNRDNKTWIRWALPVSLTILNMVMVFIVYKK